MDLRNHACHLHYIHVIKKGTVVELMNQSPFGVPARKFRDIEDIYNDEDSLRDITHSGNYLGSSASVDDCGKDGMRFFICSTGASLWRNHFGGKAAGNSSMNDSISDELTLKHIMEKCKMKRKKRKMPESHFGNETSTTGKKHSVSQADDDLSDLILPLSYLMPNIRNKRRAKVVENPDLLSQSHNTLDDFDQHDAAYFGNYHQQQIERTTQHINLTSTAVQPSCTHNEDYNSDCSIYSLSPINSNSTTVDFLGETVNSSKGSRMTVEKHAGCLLQNQQSHFDCSEAYSPRVLTMHNETGNQKYTDRAYKCLQQGYLYDLPVPKLSLQEDDSAKLLSDVNACTISLSMDLVSEKIDRSQLQPLTDKIISEVENDPVNFPCTMSGLVCASVQQQQILTSPLIVLEENLPECTNVTPLPVPDACLHALSNSVDRISDEHSMSEPCCIGNELDSLAAEYIVRDEHGNEPGCIEHGMDSLAVENFPKSDILSDRFTINKEDENLPSSEVVCQSLRTGLSHFPVSEVNVQEDTSTTSLLDVSSDALTSPVNHTSDNNIPMDMLNDYHMNHVDQQTPVNQQIDVQLLVSPAYVLKTMGEHPHMVQEIIEDAKTFSSRDCLITNLTEGMCDSTSSTSSCYSDSGVPTNHTALDNELPFAKSCSVTETGNENPTGSCSSLDKPLALEKLFSERKDSSTGLQNELWMAMENIDMIDSREKLRSLGKLVLDNQINRKKRSMVKGIEIKRSVRLFKTDMHLVSKKSGRDKKRGQCIPSSPEGAIMFSKKQMQDFEDLAKKLTRELASMKEIIEERLNNEAGTTGHINDQVITAINNASKAQQTVKKRLSLMNRDCIRFCKIMTVSENNSKDTDNPETTAQKKEKKKIKFADEAGGELCQIKFIESGEVSTPSESKL